MLVIPKNYEELKDIVKKIADHCGDDYAGIENGEYVVEGNSNITIEDLKILCEATDWNVGFVKEDLENNNCGHLDTWYITKWPNLSNKESGFLSALRGDELSMEPEGLRIWFD